MDELGTPAEVPGLHRSNRPGTAHQPTSLYRFFDSDNRLLYVGITYHLEGRFDQHRYTKPWNKIVRIEVATFPTRQAAQLAEQEAIRLEKPEWNVIYNQSEQPKPPIPSNITDGDWWWTRQKVSGFQCGRCGEQFEDRPAVMRYVKERDPFRTPRPGGHRSEWARLGWCLWLEHDACGWAEHRIYVDDKQVKRYERAGAGWVRHR